MDSPSWTDAFHSAFTSCLHCFKAPSSDSDAESLHNNSRSNRPPRHLESLLAEPVDTDTEAETVSLHSNIGDSGNRRQRTKKNKKNNSRNITLFGFDLFGKRSTTGPIHLSEDEDEEGGYHRRSRRRPSRSSSLTFDSNMSDAAPLDSAAIGERVIEEEELRAAKEREREERKRKRKDRKEMKRLAQALVQDGSAGDFEGFQGSGDNYPNIPSPFQHAMYLPNTSEDFGPFQNGVAPPVPAPMPQNDDDDADFDGGLYASRKPQDGSSVSGGGSDSRRSPGGTSASRSDYSNSRPSPVPSPLATDLISPTHHHHTVLEPQLEPKKKKKSKKSSSSSATSSSKTKSSSKSRSSASATSSDQTPSLASPISTASPVLSSDGAAAPSPLSERFPEENRKKPTPMMDFEGMQGFGAEERGFPSPGLGFGNTGSGMGMGGLGTPRNNIARGGAFLATRD
ncbi:hypothetical protein GYMLUDRAFT_38136 [Collybiopsis luxurians FD-317 M1]|nr:hypothetical protein GYMLUDRAFT_38136 [Collybiopsis luxurians FD-317 M1]